LNLKNLGQSLCFAVGMVTALSHSGCKGAGSRERQSVVESLRTQERRNGWRILVSGRGIFYLDLANSSLQPLYPGPKGPANSTFIGMASANPSGDKIVFSEGVDSRSYSLTILDLISKTRESQFQLAYLRGPRWSKDGTYIAFEGTTTETKGDSNLYLYRLGEKDFSLLVKEDVKSGDLLFCWAPDSKRIVYQSGDQKIRTVDIETKQTKTIDSGQFPTWSPSGRYISYQNGDEEYTLYDVDTSQKTRLLKDASIRRSVVWSPDSRYIVYSKLTGGLWNWVTGALSVSDSYGDLYAMDIESRIEARLYRHSGSAYATDWGKVEIESRSPVLKH
jgi:Tol biopolymer transport system component